MSSLQGKSIVVTGSGGGISAACARLAATEGAAVVVNDLDQEAVDATVAKIEAEGGNAIGVVADVADSAAAESLIEACVDAFGAIDGLVNNAGILISARADDLDEEKVRRLIEVNVLGSIFCGVHAMRRMIGQGSGSIVNVTSGAHMGLRNLSTYGASKGAIASLTYCWATDLDGTGVRVNAVSPLAGTQMVSDILEFRGSSGEQRKELLQGFPDPSNNAPLVAYLLSELAAGVTGQVIRIEGGEICLVGKPALLKPSVEQVKWAVSDVSDAFESALGDRLMPLGLLQVTGDYAFSVIKNDT